MEKLLLRPAEAGELIGVSRAQAYNMIQRGEIPCVRLGRSVRVPLEGLREHVRRLSQEQAEQPT